MSLDLNSLNPPQRAAVTTTEGPLLVLAGAGSGKTRVITYRIAYLLEKGVSPRNILAVTFTNKAAAEMRERVAQIVGPRRAQGITISTFHSFGLSVLQRDLHRLGYPRKFAILDASDQLGLVKRLLKEENDLDRKFDAKRVVSLISRVKMQGGTWKPPVGADPEYADAGRSVFDRYQKALFNMACVDFDDLILLPITLWRKDPELLEKYQQHYRYLLIDEYQDTNGTQFELVKMLAGDFQNVCAVGDDDQSIYGWRGAEVEHILRFEKQFRGVREIRLEQNYRSTGHILAAANAVIAVNKERKPKRLWTDQGDGRPIRVVAAAGEDEEARFVADEILRLQYDTRRPWGHFAVLYRTNTQARALEQALRESRVRYELHGGLQFFDRKEVKDVIAYLRVCHNPQDDVSVSRILNTPARGIGDTTIEKLHQQARREGMHLFSVLKRAAQVPDLAAPAVRAIQGFVELIAKYTERIQTDGWNRAARELCDEVDIWSECRRHVESDAAAQRKVENVRFLLDGIDKFEQRHLGEGVAGYLARLTLDRREEEPEDGAADAVTMMTLHSAKGLEWPVVFLCGVEEDLLPHSGMQGELPNPDEERRLAYVGITRAREELYLTRTVERIRHGKPTPRTPSRFLGDIPDQHLENMDLAKPTQGREAERIDAGNKFFERFRNMWTDDPEAAPSFAAPPAPPARGRK